MALELRPNCEYCDCPPGYKDNVGMERDEFLRKIRKTFRLPTRPANVVRHVLTLDVSQFTHSPREHFDQIPPIFRATGREPSHTHRLGGLLRLRGQRNGDGVPPQRNHQLSTVDHSIPCSTRNRTARETVMPSAMGSMKEYDPRRTPLVAERPRAVKQRIRFI